MATKTEITVFIKLIGRFGVNEAIQASTVKLPMLLYRG